ncbi:MAG: outer membrane beta-barrel protein [Bacteroidia bacterium]|nr:outer membrane beta-barrel protein [Bacteroidia bacterium]
MILKKIIALIIAGTPFFALGQYTISGKITDTKNEPLPGAAIALLNPNDSSVTTGTVTNLDGDFKIEKIKSQLYLIKVSYLGFGDFYKKQFINADLNLGNITLSDKAALLKDAQVVGDVLPAKLIGDTMQFNADAYKVNKDANAEDLVTKMPGVTIEDGKVKTQGEELKRVIVDGKPFFGDDPNAVLKNIPAEMIDKIQMFDQKSDQAQFTGFDDGNNTKTMNIITKQQFRNGIFGRVYGSYGTDDRYKGGLALNFFKEKRRFTILMSSNNINEQNFSSEDLAGVMSGSGGGGPRMGGGMRPPMGMGGGRPTGTMGQDASSFFVDQKKGLTQTHSIGLNYSNTFGKVEISGSYFFNYADNVVKSNTQRTYFTNENNPLLYNEVSNKNIINSNHRANLKIEYKIDSANSITVQPRITFQLNDQDAVTVGKNESGNILISNTNNKTSASVDASNFTMPVLYKHAFDKKGRTISFNLTPGFNSNKGNSNLYSYNVYALDSLSTDSINQLTNSDAQGKVFSGNVTYTEPVGKKGQLLFTYNNNYNLNNSDKKTYNYQTVSDSYTDLDATLSNVFESRYMANNGGISYMYTQTKWNATAGLSYQVATLKNEQTFPQSDNLNKTFYSLLPNAQFQYKFTTSKNMRVNYRSSNNAPSVTQLQNVVNNSNPLQLTAGNPNLSQDWQNNVNIRYSSVNTLKSTNLFAVLNLTKTEDYIANTTYFALTDTQVAGVNMPAGSQLTVPQNLNGYYNVRMFSNYGFPFKAIKSNLNINANANLNRTPGQINFVNNYAYTTSVGTGFSINSNISPKIDFSVGSYFSYNNITNTQQSQANNEYLNLNTRLRMQFTIWKGLVLQSDVTNQHYAGLADNLNQDFILWNAGIGYKFLKNDAAELRLTVFDILNQNNSFNRNTTETYFEDVTTNVLTQYFMINFTYNIKYFKNAGKEN